MRDIKFRAWNVELNKFVCWYQQGLSMVGDTGELYLSGSMNVTYRFVLQQFTGLQDKNGVEIYEGDIIYLAGYGDYKAEFPFLELYEAAMESDIGEVKGNIYENPELLEQ